ncbi:MAG TPA: hypothetical protein VGZ47_20980 [Gemmataceae bacterium]|nr:hypothetical protein [Gemmataceae bacterium]
MAELLHALTQILTDLLQLFRLILVPVLFTLPYLLWFFYCLLAVNWKKLAPTLRGGAWLPAVLISILVALAWSQISPTSVRLFGFMHLGNFWWQAGAVAIWGCLGLFAGWLQQRYSWTPKEIAIEPPPVHGHGHRHH